MKIILHILICNFNFDFDFFEINLVSARFAFFEKLYCLESDNFQILIKQPKNIVLLIGLISKLEVRFWSHMLKILHKH
jgi:hypothetical protein